MYKATSSHIADLESLQRRLRTELDAADAPWTDDALALRDLDSWIDGVLGSRGRIRSEAMRDLWNQGQRLPHGTRARGYFDDAHAVVADADVETGRGPAISGSLRTRMFEVAALFLAWFLLFLVTQHYALHHSWHESVETALVIAATWAVMHVLVEGLRPRRSRRQARR